VFRYLVVPVLLALLLVPDWASAFGRRRPLFAQRTQHIATPYPVQYSQPVYYSAPPVQYYAPVVYHQGCQPGTVIVPSGPVIVPEQMTPPVKPRSNVQTEPQAQPKAIEPEPSLKPASNVSETLPAMKDPVPVIPVAKPKEPELIPVTPVVKPKELEPLPSMKFDTNPKKDVPKLEELPKLELPKFESPSVPPLAAPAPIDALPVPTESKSSPLNSDLGLLKIERFPVEGMASPSLLRLVTFYNFSSRELTLTIAGREVVVPGKHSVEAKLPTTFEWQIGDTIQASGTIPDSASGLDIVIRK
jgi:hypothetical protein